MSITSEVKEIVREMGPVTAAEVITLMPHVARQRVFSTLYSLRARGVISAESVANTGSGRRKTVNSHTWGGEPCLPPSKLGKLKSPTPKAQAFNDSELRAKIAELEEWKASAIARYPDLGVDPDVLRLARLSTRC